MSVRVAVGVVLARVDSERLPGKVLAEVMSKPLIGYVFDRVKRISELNRLILATTDRSIDDPLAEYAAHAGVEVFRGDTGDVAGRVLAATDGRSDSLIIRFNGDSPWIDPVLVSSALREYSEETELLSSKINGGFPYGIAVEVFTRSLLARMHPRMSMEDREHVTSFFYDHLDEVRWASLEAGDPVIKTSLVVDTPSDLVRFEQLIELLGKNASSIGWREISALARQLDISNSARSQIS